MRNKLYFYMADKLWLNIDREFSRQISQHLWIRTDSELTTKLDDLLNEELEREIERKLNHEDY